jgi:hypothetical protein
MKRILAALILIAAVDAGAQIAWDVPLPNHPQYKANIYRGESIYLQPRILLQGMPLTMSTNAVVYLAWWTNSTMAAAPWIQAGSVYTNYAGTVRVLWPSTNLIEYGEASGYIAVEDNGQRLCRAQIAFRFMGTYAGTNLASPTQPDSWAWASRIEALAKAAVPSNTIYAELGNYYRMSDPSNTFQSATNVTGGILGMANRVISLTYGALTNALAGLYSLADHLHAYTVITNAPWALQTDYVATSNQAAAALPAGATNGVE